MSIGTRRTSPPLAGLCALLVILATGCGTIMSKGARNQTPGAAPGSSGVGHPYTGARCDAAYMRAVARGGWNIPLGLLAAVDLPISAVEDTLFLPVDLALSSDQPWNADDACGLRDR